MKKLLFTLSILLGLNTGTLTAELTQTQLNATLGIVTSFILDDGITFHGKSYKTVTSPYTGRVWLDRNLGADRVCTSMDDVQCYGNYYQWGRAANGHEDSNSSLTAALATDVSILGNGLFIASFDDWASIDSNGSIRSVNWSKTDGTSICPTGFRVPTLSELSLELLDPGSARIDTNIDAYNSFLKLPSSGYRVNFNGSMNNVSTTGYLWTSSVSSDPRSIYLFFSGSDADWYNGSRANGMPVRCIKD